MRSKVAIGLLSYLAGNALATCDASCSKYTIPTCAADASNTCLEPASGLKVRQFPHSHLYRRTCDGCPPKECSADSKKCTPGGQQPPKLTPKTINFSCGQMPTPHSATVTYDSCPFDATKKCLIVQLSGESLKQPELEISFTPLTKSAPGQFRYNTYCVGSPCAVPIDVVLANDGKVLGDLCSGLPLWVGLHSGLGGETCWAQGDPIPGQNDKGGNWAMQFPITFQCPIAHEVCCCCAPPLPDKKCKPETAYASGANTYNLPDLGCTNAWGYYQKFSAEFLRSVPVGGSVYSANLLAGKTNDVGDATVTRTSSTCFFVTLDAAPGYGVGLTHINISCRDPRENLGTFCRAPGKYKFNSGCVSTNPYTGGNVCAEAECTGSWYFIIHAETYSIVSPNVGDAYNDCVPYNC